MESQRVTWTRPSGGAKPLRGPRSHHLSTVLGVPGEIAAYSGSMLVALIRGAAAAVGAAPLADLIVTVSAYGPYVVVLLEATQVALHVLPGLASLRIDIHVSDDRREDLDRARALAKRLSFVVGRTEATVNWEHQLLAA